MKGSGVPVTERPAEPNRPSDRRCATRIPPGGHPALRSTLLRKDLRRRPEIVAPGRPRAVRKNARRMKETRGIQS